MFASERAVVIGLDAPITKSILKYSEKGRLPNLTKLIKNGVWAENCLVPHPTITPPNWTSIATGAWPGTHGITCFNMHKPSWPLDYCPEAFSSLDCQAEYIWEAAERVGKRAIVLNYPSSWPPKGKNLIQVGGAGLHINEWRSGRDGSLLSGSYLRRTVAAEQLVSTQEYPLADVVHLRKADLWDSLPEGRHLETEVTLGHRNTYDEVRPIKVFILVHDPEGKGYEKVSFATEKNSAKIVFTLREGEWSERQSLAFETDKGKKRCVFKAKLIELSSDAKRLRLFFTPFCQLDGWTYPPEVAEELENIPGINSNPTPPLNLGWIDSETWLELTREENTWLGEAATRLLKKYDWTLFFMHAHAPDHFYHAALNKIEPTVCKDKTIVGEYSRVEEEMYASLDEMIGKILDAIDEKTLVFIVSDHGVAPTEGRYDEGFQALSVNKILNEAGLLTFRTDDKTGRKVVDWSKTRAAAQRACYVYVNLKGRDPDGIVEPKDYDGVRDEVINALYSYTDSKSGKKPVALALKKEDARILGLYGDRVGDVVYASTKETSGEHGRKLTTGEYGVGSMKGLLIIAGPNIKKGYMLRRTVWLPDVVPTVSYLLGLPIPKDAEGAIIYQALESPDYLIEELHTLRRNYNLLKTAYEGQKSLTHNYE